MGLILDSSVLIAAERAGKNARQILTGIAEEIGETEVGISVITVIEMVHGAVRADTPPQRKSKREKFVEDLLIAMPVYPVTVPIAIRTGQLDGQNQLQGIKIPLPDIIIGVTAAELDYGVGTANLRHFKQIPGLKVVQL